MHVVQHGNPTIQGHHDNRMRFLQWLRHIVHDWHDLAAGTNFRGRTTRFPPSTVIGLAYVACKDRSSVPCCLKMSLTSLQYTRSLCPQNSSPSLQRTFLQATPTNLRYWSWFTTKAANSLDWKWSRNRFVQAACRVLSTPVCDKPSNGRPSNTREPTLTATP
jgi:hypothetical protein